MQSCVLYRILQYCSIWYQAKGVRAARRAARVGRWVGGTKAATGLGMGRDFPTRVDFEVVTFFRRGVSWGSSGEPAPAGRSQYSVEKYHANKVKGSTWALGSPQKCF